MNRKFFAVLALIFQVSTIAAASKKEDCPEILGAVKKPFFYVIEKNKNKSFLLGTLHVGVSLTDLPDFVRASLEASDIIVLEVVGEEMKKSGLDKLYFLFTGFQIGSLSKQLSQRSWRILRYKLARDGIPPWLIDHLSPHFALFLFETPSEESLYSHQLDADIEDWAKSKGIPRMSLDKKDIQSRFFKNLKSVIDVQDLEKVLTRASQMDQDIFEAYRNGDENYFRSDAENLPSRFRQHYLLDRNKAWANQLTRSFEPDLTRFVLVGATHLFSDQGLIRLLEVNGFKVTRVISLRDLIVAMR